MKRFTFIGMILLVMFAVGLMSGQEKKMAKDKEKTIKGEVVDVACYLKSGGKGDDHKACAEACAKGGGTLGILTDDGKLYVSLLPDDHKNNPNAILMDHVAHKVEASGMIRSKNGVSGIMITKVEMQKMDEMKK